MTTNESRDKSGDEDWHVNGDARGDSETLPQEPKESDPLQPKSLKLKVTKEVKEVRLKLQMYLGWFEKIISFLSFSVENIGCFSYARTEKRDLGSKN